MCRGRAARLVGLAGAVLILGLSVSSAVAQNPPKLRYGYQKGQEYGYDVKITADLPEEEQTREGVLTYSVTSATEEQFVLRCTGGLALKTKPKTNTRSFGPPGFGWGFRRMGPSFRFGQPEGVTLSRTGTVIVEGAGEHLPLLLGPEEVLVVEPLADAPQANWHKETEMRVVENSGSGRAFFRGAMGQTKTGAKEQIDFTVLEQKGDTIRISKKYSLQTAEDKGVRYIDMSGTGELEFDAKRGVITSLSMSYKILVNGDNITMTVPVTLRCRMLNEAEMAERKKKLEAEAAARAEAERPKPFEPGERQRLLAELRAAEANQVKAAAQRLAKTIPDDKPSEISAALARTLKRQADPWVQVEIIKAAKVWPGSELEKPLVEAAKSQSFFVRDAAIDALGQLKTPAAAAAVAAQLPKSRHVAGVALRAMGPVAESAVLPYLNDRDFWIRTEAYGILGEIGGKKSLQAMNKKAPEIEMMERHAFDKAIAAIRIRAADDEEDTPAADAPAAPTANSEWRTWRDATGTFEVEARFVSYQDEKVMLQRKDGRKITLPCEKLSDEDQAFVKKQPQPVNPFE